MPQPLAPKAVLFDLDHTLTDRVRSMELVAAQLARKFASRLDARPAQQLRDCMRNADQNGYRPKEEFFQELTETIPWNQRPTVDQLASFWAKYFPRCTAERSGAIVAMHHCRSRDAKIGVVTNGSTMMQNAKIDALKIRPLLSCIIVSETVGFKKPDARIYQIALEQMKIPPFETVFIGDNPMNDVIAPAQLGIKSIWLRDIFDWPTNHPAPRYAIASLSELHDLI